MYKETPISAATYRLIPSHFPPIRLFENLLDPDELDAAYELESLTNDRLRDEAGDIRLVMPEDRVSGPGSTPIMAAFTHIGVESRFTKGGYGVYYAGLELETAIVESKFSRARFLKATNEGPQTITMRCYSCQIDSLLVDVRGDIEAHHPTDFSYAQSTAQGLRVEGQNGILYDSVRRPGGRCVAAFKPNALVPPAIQTGHFQYTWDGNSISHTHRLEEVSTGDAPL
ncbi:RES family NAD+ phosphorylase (plasmid) [Microbulbifer sp. ANSA003]|uniref:RES family NAD+ phosphorylase n=1 Tax=Microbulbifer sp. ANSA003 TaxID=3243360 RepID=UPI004041D288